MNKGKVPNYFWLPKKCYNTCVSGLNENTLGHYNIDSHARKYAAYFSEVTLPQLRKESASYPPDKKFLKSARNYNPGFCDIVNDALSKIYKNKVGCVYSTEQVKEILRFVPGANVVAKGDGFFRISNN